MKTKAIHKAFLHLVDNQVISIPVGAEILSVQVQRDVPCLWYSFELENQFVQRSVEIFIVGTGHQFDEQDNVKMEFIGTVQVADGDLVFHVFKKVEWPGQAEIN